MQNTRVSHRYAKSLIDLSIERNSLEDVNGDMSMLSDAIGNNRDLDLLLKSPVIRQDKKEAVIKAVFAEQLTELSMLFIEILLRKKREALLGPIADSFVRQYKRHKGIITAHITTAFQLNDELRNKVRKVVAGAYSGQIDLVEYVDENIIGGIVIRVEDKQMDASVARKIRELKQEFSKNPYIPEF